MRADVSERRDAEQRVATLQDQLRQAADEKAVEQRTLAEAKAEHDRISAETATAQQSADALKQRVAVLEGELAAKKSDAARSGASHRLRPRMRWNKTTLRSNSPRLSSSFSRTIERKAAEQRALAELETHAKAQRAEIERSISGSAARRELLIANAEKARRSLADLQRQLAVASQRQHELANLNAQVEKARRALGGLQKQAATKRKALSFPVQSMPPAATPAPAPQEVPPIDGLAPGNSSP